MNILCELVINCGNENLTIAESVLAYTPCSEYLHFHRVERGRLLGPNEADEEMPQPGYYVEQFVRENVTPDVPSHEFVFPWTGCTCQPTRQQEPAIMWRDHDGAGSSLFGLFDLNVRGRPDQGNRPFASWALLVFPRLSSGVTTCASLAF
jgi:hypothetical protein